MFLGQHARGILPGSLLALPLLLVAGATAPFPPARAAQGCPPLPSPSEFVAEIDNRYLPLRPGTTFVYQGREGGEALRDVVEVTHKTRVILGVTTTVVKDTVTTRAGRLVEKTVDWYAQDRDGNVWYFGEDTKEYENGRVVSTEGSWEAGVNGAQPGIVMEAQPRVGDEYQQECAPGVAEDMAKVLDLGATTRVPFGPFRDVLATEEWSPLEPGVVDHKYYAPCLGEVKEVTVSGGSARSVLVDVRPRSHRGASGTSSCSG